MELLGTFETIAEIAIALTGFTGIVVVVSQRQRDEWDDAESFRLKTLLYWSLGTVFLAFVPAGLVEVAPTDSVWRLAHGIFALFHGYVFLWFFTQTRRLAIRATPVSWALIGFGALVLAGELCVALGAFPQHAAFLYLVALLWFLFLSAFSFAAFLFPRDSRRSDG